MRDNMTIRIGHSPDADDAFMFYGFASGKVTIPHCDIVHVLHDIQTLNTISSGLDPLEVTALSAHAFFEVEERYQLLPIGTSVGRGYGPRVISKDHKPVQSLHGATIALPGPLTTATLVARGLLPSFKEVHANFLDIIRLVQSGEVDAGVVIHEGQITYDSLGLSLVCDLGEMFKTAFGLPLPLGVNCVRRDLDPELRRQIETSYRASVTLAIDEVDEAVKYAQQYGRGLSAELTERFVRMYVNEDSLSLSADVIAGLNQLRSFHQAQKELHARNI